MVEVPHAFEIIELSAAERLLSLSADVAMLWAVVEEPEQEAMAKVQSDLFKFCTDAYGSSAPAQRFWDSVSADKMSDTQWRDLMIKAAEAIPPMATRDCDGRSVHRQQLHRG